MKHRWTKPNWRHPLWSYGGIRNYQWCTQCGVEKITSKGYGRAPRLVALRGICECQCQWWQVKRMPPCKPYIGEPLGG